MLSHHSDHYVQVHMLSLCCLPICHWRHRPVVTRGTALSPRTKQAVVIPGSNVEPLALNITLCQVMVSLSQKKGAEPESDGDWLTPLRAFVRDTLSSGLKLSYRQLYMLLGTVWKMVLTQRSKSKSCFLVRNKRSNYSCVGLYIGS